MFLEPCPLGQLVPWQAFARISISVPVPLSVLCKHHVCILTPCTWAGPPQCLHQSYKLMGEAEAEANILKICLSSSERIFYSCCRDPSQDDHSAVDMNKVDVKHQVTEGAAEHFQT